MVLGGKPRERVFAVAGPDSETNLDNSTSFDISTNSGLRGLSLTSTRWHLSEVPACLHVRCHQESESTPGPYHAAVAGVKIDMPIFGASVDYRVHCYYMPYTSIDQCRLSLQSTAAILGQGKLCLFYCCQSARPMLCYRDHWFHFQTHSSYCVCV